MIFYCILLGAQNIKGKLCFCELPVDRCYVTHACHWIFIIASSFSHTLLWLPVYFKSFACRSAADHMAFSFAQAVEMLRFQFPIVKVSCVCVVVSSSSCFFFVYSTKCARIDNNEVNIIHIRLACAKRCLNKAIFWIRLIVFRCDWL